MSIYPKPRHDIELQWIRERYKYVGGRDPIRTLDGKIPNYIRQKRGGYIYIEFYVSGIGVRVALSHVVWYLNTGYWPTLQVDHEDNDTENNEFENLQELTHAQNNARKTEIWRLA